MGELIVRIEGGEMGHPFLRYADERFTEISNKVVEGLQEKLEIAKEKILVILAPAEGSGLSISAEVIYPASNGRLDYTPDLKQHLLDRLKVMLLELFPEHQIVCKEAPRSSRLIEIVRLIDKNEQKYLATG